MTYTRSALNFQEGEMEGNDLECTHTVRQTQGESKFKMDQSKPYIHESQAVHYRD